MYHIFFFQKKRTIKKIVDICRSAKQSTKNQNMRFLTARVFHFLSHAIPQSETLCKHYAEVWGFKVFKKHFVV